MISSEIIDPTTEFYKAAGKLLDIGISSVNPNTCTAEYESIILSSYCKSPMLKELVAWEIPKYFKHFSSLHERALNAQLDLCADGNANVRQAAIKGLPILARVQFAANRISNALIHLLIDQEFRDVVCQALLGCFTVHPSGST